jgi:hypothetical protein
MVIDMVGCSKRSTSDWLRKIIQGFYAWEYNPWDFWRKVVSAGNGCANEVMKREESDRRDNQGKR